MKNRKLLTFFIFALLFFNTPAKAQPAQTLMFLTYNGGNVSGPIYAAAFACHDNISASNIQNSIVMSHLNVSAYSLPVECYWKDTNFTLSEAHCSNSTCLIIFPTYPLRMVFYIPSLNKTFVSDEDQLPGEITNATNSSNVDYLARTNVQLYSNGTAVFSGVYTPGITTAQANRIADIKIAITTLELLILTLIIEIPIVFLYLRKQKIKNRKRILLIMSCLTAVSLPVLVFVGPWFSNLLGQASLVTVVVEWLLVVLLSWPVIYYSDKRSISVRNATVLVILMTLAFFAALFLYLVLYAIFVPPPTL